MPGPAFRRGDAAALCPVERDDLAFVKRLRNDPDVRWGLRMASTPTNEQTLEEWFEEDVAEVEDEQAAFLLVPDDADDPVGYVELSGVERPAGRGRISYCLAPADRGQGYATAAIDLLTGYAIEERRLHRVTATVLVDDEPTREAFERAGFTEEETRREELYVDGAYHDAVSYAMLEDEWGGA